jgi:FtsH-binding integral membrane protein
MAFYTDQNGRVVSDERRYEEQPKKASKSHSFSLAKVFGYMFAGLLITAVVAFGMGAIFAYWLNIDFETASGALFVVMIASAIVTIILSIVMSFSLRKKSTMAMAVPAVIYAVCIGFLLSSFTIYLDWWLLATAFGITSLVFGLMALISLSAKGNMSGLSIVGIGLFVGCGILSLVNLLIMLIAPSIFQPMYWIISLGMFAAVMFITMFDIWNIKRICQTGELSNNLALYCAFTLYVDFIYIFVRILTILARFSNNN